MLACLGALNGKDLTQARFQVARMALWRAFAAHGLGVDASCQGPSLRKIVEGRTVPQN